MTSARREQTRKGLSMLLGTPTPPARTREEPRPTALHEARVEHAPSAANGSPELPLSVIDPDPEQPRKLFE